MLRLLPVIWLLLVFATASQAADTQYIYKWTDDQGHREKGARRKRHP